MLTRIIEVERDYDSTALCELCFSTSQKATLYKINMGFENNGVVNKKGKVLCSSCLKVLKTKLENIY